MVDVGDQLVLHVLLARLKHRIDFDFDYINCSESSPEQQSKGSNEFFRESSILLEGGKARVCTEDGIKKNDKLLVSITKSLDRCAYR